MNCGLIVASSSPLVKVWLAGVVATIEILLYRAAFPPGEDGRSVAGKYADPVPVATPAPATAKATQPIEPLIDSRPRMTCPQCSELVLVEARLCRFCGYRFADKLEPQ
jgi:hypothetical protein